MSYLYACIIPLISFILQAYPRFFNKYFGVDVWTRLIETDLIRSCNHRIPNRISKGFIIHGNFDYPPLFPLLLSFIPKLTLEKLQGFIAPFIDSIQCFIVFLIANQLTGSLPISLTAQMMYMLTPLVALENSYLTPRSFGYLNFTLAFYPMLLFSVTPKLEYLIVSYFFTTLIFLSHRFAAQALLFIILFFTIVDGTIIYIGVFLGGAITATLLTQGYYLRVLKGHLYNIYFWVKNYHLRFAHQIRGQLKEGKQRDFINVVYFILSKFTPIGLIGTNVWLVSSFIFLFGFFNPIPHIPADNTMLLKMSVWVMFFYLVSIIVLSNKRLIPIGEGQRYIEMATVPSSILASILFWSLLPYYSILLIGILTILCIGNLTIILLIQQKAILKDTNRTLTLDMNNMYAYIRKLKGTPRIMCIPHQITTMTTYNTQADVLVNVDNPGLMRITDVYPVIRVPIVTLTKKYRLDYLLLRESFATTQELKLKKPTVVFRSGENVLIKLT